MTALEGRESELDFMTGVWYFHSIMSIKEHNSAFNFYWWWHTKTAGESSCR